MLEKLLKSEVPIEDFIAAPERGVTTMVGHVFGTDLSHIPEQILLNAQIRGTAVHKYIEDYFKGEEPELHWEYHTYRDGFNKWLDQFEEVKPVALEYRFIDEGNVKGVIDFIGYLDGELYVIDWKTSSNMSGETLMSATAQSLCYREIIERQFGVKCKTRVVSIQMNKFADYELENDDELAHKLYDLYAFKNQYKKPRRRKK